MVSTKDRLIGAMPRIGIRPTIDGRRKGVRESLEAQTMALAASVAGLLTGSLSFPFWAGVVLLGLLLPLTVEMSLILRGVESPPREVAGILAVMVLAGGLILRAVIVYGGQL